MSNIDGAFVWYDDKMDQLLGKQVADAAMNVVIEGDRVEISKHADLLQLKEGTVPQNVFKIKFEGITQVEHHDWKNIEGRFFKDSFQIRDDYTQFLALVSELTHNAGFYDVPRFKDSHAPIDITYWAYPLSNGSAIVRVAIHQISIGEFDWGRIIRNARGERGFYSGGNRAFNEVRNLAISERPFRLEYNRGKVSGPEGQRDLTTTLWVKADRMPIPSEGNAQSSNSGSTDGAMKALRNPQGESYQVFKERMLQKYPKGIFKVRVWDKVRKKIKEQDFWAFAEELLFQAQNGYSNSEDEALAKKLRTMKLAEFKKEIIRYLRVNIYPFNRSKSVNDVLKAFTEDDPAKRSFQFYHHIAPESLAKDYEMINALAGNDERDEQFKTKIKAYIRGEEIRLVYIGEILRRWSLLMGKDKKVRPADRAMNSDQEIQDLMKGGEILGIPSVASILKLAREEHVFIVIARRGDFAWKFLSDRQLNGTAFLEGELHGWAEYFKISEKDLLAKFGLPADASKFVIIAEEANHNPHLTLFEEILHEIEGPSDVMLFAVREAINDFIQLLFFPDGQINLFVSPYTHWDSEEKRALQKRFLAGNRNPNTADILKIFQDLYDAIDKNESIMVGHRQENIISLFFRSSITLNEYRRQALYDDAKRRYYLNAKVYLKDLINHSRFNNRERLFSDWGPNQAMNVLEQRKSDLGGIDLNPAQMSMQVKKQGEDFKFNFNGTEIDTAQVTGATFTIRQMTPVTNLPLILGLNQEPAGQPKQEIRALLTT